MELSDSDDDVHQCGRCKELFHSIDTYFTHKKAKKCIKVKLRTNVFDEQAQNVIEIQRTVRLVQPNKKLKTEQVADLTKSATAPSVSIERGGGLSSGRDAQGSGVKCAEKETDQTMGNQLDSTTGTTQAVHREGKPRQTMPNVSKTTDPKQTGTWQLKNTTVVHQNKTRANQPKTNSDSRSDKTKVISHPKSRPTKTCGSKVKVEDVSAKKDNVSMALDIENHLPVTAVEVTSIAAQNLKTTLPQKQMPNTESVAQANKQVHIPTVVSKPDSPKKSDMDKTVPVYGRGWRKATPKKAWVEDYIGIEASDEEPLITDSPLKQKEAIAITPTKDVKDATPKPNDIPVKRKRGRPRKYPVRPVEKRPSRHHPSADGGPWQCPMCEYTGEFRDEFDRHLRCLHNLSNWVCQRCGQPFKDKYKQQRHQTAAECQLVKSITWSQGTLEGYVEFPIKKSLDPIPDDCQTEENDLAEHNTRKEVGAEGINSKTEPPQTASDADFTCYICAETFESYEVIMEHITVHTDIQPGICRFCGKWFRSKYKVWRHMSSSVHDNIKEQDIKKAKQEMANLKVNWKQDSTSFSYPKMYHCQECGKVFSTKLMFEKHNNRYHGEEPCGTSRFKCESCDKWFNKRKNYQNHLMYEHGIDDEHLKSFKCPVCAKVFTQKTHVFRHVDTLHTPQQQIPDDMVEKDEVFGQNRGEVGKYDKHRYICFVCKKAVIGFTVYYRHVYNHRTWVVNGPNGPNPDRQLMNKLYDLLLFNRNIQTKMPWNIPAEKRTAAIQEAQQAAANTSLSGIVDQSTFGDLVQQQSLLSFLQDVGNQLITTAAPQDQPISSSHQQQPMHMPPQQGQSVLQQQTYSEPLQPLVDSLPQGEKIPTQAVVHHHPQPLQEQEALQQQQQLPHINVTPQQTQSTVSTTTLNMDTHATLVHVGPGVEVTTPTAISASPGPCNSNLDQANEANNLAEGLKTALDSVSLACVPGVALQSTKPIETHVEGPIASVSSTNSPDNSEPQRLLCVYCNQSYCSIREVYDHKVNDHSLVSAFCCVLSDCQKLFYKVMEFEAHAKVHSQVCFICHLCNAHFDDMNDLLGHKTSVHRGLNTGIEAHRCPLCHRSFSSKEAYSTHMSNADHQFPCSQCGKVLGCQNLLKDHEAEHIGLENFLCDICGVTFKSKTQLNRHRSANHVGKVHKCTICDVEFNKPEHLRRHLVSKHSDDKPYQCSVQGCMKAFKRKDKLQDHLRSHSTTKPYHCGLCSKSYRYREGLKYHEKTHGQQAKYFCNLCHEGFVRPASVRVHMKEVHEIELKATHSYPCELCTTIFARPERLKRHMEKIHQVSSDWKFTCKACNKGFAGGKSLLTHMKHSHGAGAAAVIKIKPQIFKDDASEKEQPVVVMSEAQFAIHQQQLQLVSSLPASTPQSPPAPVVPPPHQTQQKILTITEITQNPQTNKPPTISVVPHTTDAAPMTPVAPLSPVVSTMTVPALSSPIEVQVPTLIRSVPQVMLKPGVNQPLLPSTTGALTVTTSAAPMLITHPSLLQPIQITAYQPPNMQLTTQQLRPTTILNSALNNPVLPTQNQLINTVAVSLPNQTSLQLQPVTRMLVSANPQSQADVSLLTTPLQGTQQLSTLPFTQIAQYAPFSNYNYNQVFQPINQPAQTLQQQQQPQIQQPQVQPLQAQQLHITQQVRPLVTRTQ